MERYRGIYFAGSVELCTNYWADSVYYYKLISLMKKIFISTTLILAVASPLVSMAIVTDFKSLVDFFIGAFIQPVIILIFSAAIVFFLWNMLMLVMKSDQPDEIKEFKSRVVWGIVAIFVMSAMYGLVKFITGSLNLDNTVGQINVRSGP